MRRGLVLAAMIGVATASTTAHAMGTYITLELVAWSDDGTTAIVKRTTSSSGTAGAATEYILVGTRDAPTVTSFHSTLSPDTASEQIDTTACTKAGDAFAQLVTHRRFSGVVLHRDRCKTAERDVVTITPAGASLAAASSVPISEGDGDTMATRTGALLVMFTGENGDSSRPAHAKVLVPTPTGLQVRFDLRDAGRP